MWENNSPTSRFGVQNVTLSDSITNYKYIGIYWRESVSSAKMSFYMMPIEYFNYDSTSPAGIIGSALVGYNSSGKAYARNWFKENSLTDIHFAMAFRLENESGYNNDIAIPLKIVGLN